MFSMVFFLHCPNIQPEDDPDYIDLGAAILTFHSILVNLLGYCAPDMETVKSESIRARSILQSLVSMADLEGVLSLRFILPPPKLEVQVSVFTILFAIIYSCILYY